MLLHKQTNSERRGRTPREVIVTYLCPPRIYYCYPEFHSGSLLTKINDSETLKVEFKIRACLAVKTLK